MEGTKRVVRKLKRVQKNLETKPDAAIQRELRKVQQRQRQKIVANNSIASQVLINGLDLRLRKVKGGSEHAIQSTAPHSGFVEFGTGPRNVADSIDYQYSAPTLTDRLVFRIKAWMIMKGVAPQTGSMDSSAFLIARRISTTPYEGRTGPPGTDPQPFFFNSMWEHEHLLRSAIRNAVKKSVRA